jgi:hypothetical protein
MWEMEKLLPGVAGKPLRDRDIAWGKISVQEITPLR